MKVICPKCKQVLPADAINVARDLAYCAACNEGFELSNLVDPEELEPEPVIDFNNPPGGVMYEAQPEGFVLSASARSCLPIFLIPFMCVWSGGSLGGIYGTQIMSGKFNLWFSLFGIPFILGTLLMLWANLMGLFGKVRLTVQGNEGEIFTGFGTIGRTKRFRINEVTKVREQVSRGKSTTYSIVIEGPEEVRFGSELSTPRREFFMQVLKKITRKN